MTKATDPKHSFYTLSVSPRSFSAESRCPITVFTGIAAMTQLSVVTRCYSIATKKLIRCLSVTSTSHF